MPRRTTQQEKKQKNKTNTTARWLTDTYFMQPIGMHCTGWKHSVCGTPLFSLSTGTAPYCPSSGAAASEDAAGSAPCPGDAAGYELRCSAALCSPCSSWTDSTPDVNPPPPPELFNFHLPCSLKL